MSLNYTQPMDITHSVAMQGVKPYRYFKYPRRATKPQDGGQGVSSSRQLHIRNKPQDHDASVKLAAERANQYVLHINHQLEKAVHDILFEDADKATDPSYTWTPHKISQEELYQGVQSLCKFRKSQELWQFLNSKLLERLSAIRSSLQYVQPTSLPQGSLGSNYDSKNVDQFIQNCSDVVNVWIDFSNRLHVLHNVYFYLDRDYLIKQQGINLLEYGKSLFYSRVLAPSESDPLHIWQALSSGFSYCIHRARIAHTTSVDPLAKRLVQFWNIKTPDSGPSPSPSSESSSSVGSPFTLRFCEGCKDESQRLAELHPIDGPIARYLTLIKQTIEFECALSKEIGFPAKVSDKVAYIVISQMFYQRSEQLLAYHIPILYGDYENHTATLAYLFELCCRDESKEALSHLKAASDVYIRTQCESISKSSVAKNRIDLVKKLIRVQQVIWAVSELSFLGVVPRPSRKTTSSPSNQDAALYDVSSNVPSNVLPDAQTSAISEGSSDYSDSYPSSDSEEEYEEVGLMGFRNRRSSGPNDDDNGSGYIFTADYPVHSSVTPSRSIKESVESFKSFSSYIRKSLPKVLQNPDYETIVAEAMSKYCDNLLRVEIPGTKSDKEITASLQPFMGFFRIFEAKDIFEAFYKKDLSRRLLQDKVQDQAAEEKLVLMFKEECGAMYTQKMENMLRDIAISHTEQNSFKKYLRGPNSVGRVKMPFMPTILTQGKWPQYPELSVVLPSAFAQQIQAFEGFYHSIHEGRTLRWYHNLGSCVMKARFKDGAKEISMPLLQAVVLMQLNDEDRDVSFEELKAATGFDDNTLSRCLASFLFGKYDILIKTPSTRKIRPTDSFAVNANFTNKASKIKISNINVAGFISESTGAAANSEVEAIQTRKEVMRDRTYELQAAIVRTMKAESRLSHAVLIQKVIEKTVNRGAPTVEEIKNSIEDLISREMMARDKDNPDLYVYI